MRWSITPSPEVGKVEHLQEALGIDSIVATLLIQRGIETYDQAEQFFCPSLESLYNPYLMKDMEEAVNRILIALKKNERILIYGDYDVDGTTSVAMFTSFMKTLSNNIDTYLPDRYNEGYGISKQSIDFAKDNQFSLIVALDCGIRAVDLINYANSININFIICDHHIPGEHLPNAVAILNPKQKDCQYPYKDLCGCGVGFKLIQGIAKKLNIPTDDYYTYLDYVAVAIAADIVPITGENRNLSHYGLKLINAKHRIGFSALLPEKNKNISISDIVFQIAPKINASGRISDAQKSVDLLMETDENQAKTYAKHIISLNEQRRDLEKVATTEALEQIENNNLFSTVVASPNWHKGVVGIVASRLIETHYRPTIVLSEINDELVGSARSIKGFSIYNAIKSCDKYLTKYGGHDMAAGLSLLKSNYEDFKNCFENYIASHIDRSLLEPEISIQMSLKFNQISEKLVRILRRFEPFGPQNMTPIFYANNLFAKNLKAVGKKSEHLKLWIYQDNQKNNFSAIGFNLGEKIKFLKNQEKFSAVFSIEENTWHNITNIQLRIRDINI